MPAEGSEVYHIVGIAGSKRLSCQGAECAQHQCVRQLSSYDATCTC